MDISDKFCGLLVLGSDGEVILGVGAGREDAVIAECAAPAWIREARHRRLVSVQSGDVELLAVALPCEDALAVVFRPAPGDAVVEFVGAVDFAYDIINQLINDPFDAMTVVDSDARLAFISPVHESFFGLNRGEATGQPARDVIENTGLDRVVQTGKAEVGEIQHMRGGSRVVTRTPIMRDGQTVGAIGRVMFKGPQEIQALSRRVQDLEAEVAFYRREADALRGRAFGLDSIVGESPAVQQLKADIVRVAPLDVPVLIRGESGVGKELVAHALHTLSPRRGQSMVTVNAAALPASLVESELFGYAAGAFTGADRKGRKGKFELADQSTLFMDEIGDMPADVQAKLLRVVQDGVLDRVGGGKPKTVDFRLITATNQDLPTLVDGEAFRLDLYYRISPVVLSVPALRDRPDDIGALTAFFLEDFCTRHGRPLPEIDSAALDFLEDQPWPGNVRQLRNEIERAAIFSDARQLTVADFDHGAHPDSPPAAECPAAPAGSAKPFKDALERLETELIRDALARQGGNKRKAAEDLGISRSLLYKKLTLLEK